MIITIDGPTASGKSTIARMLADKLDMYYINSGFLYRACAYVFVNECHYTLDTLSGVSADLIDTWVAQRWLVYQYESLTGARVLYQSRDITPYLKSADMDRASSIMATSTEVREHITQWQRSLACDHDVIAEGRDAGSVVFPHADVKIYLTASLDTRAQRWQRMQREKYGVLTTLDKALEAVAERDKRDAQREHAPLVVPYDALVIHNDTLSLEGSIAYICKSIQVRGFARSCK
jgi:cytidylate kinase